MAQMKYAAFLLFDDRPGLVDYLGSFFAANLSDAEAEAERRYGPVVEDERFDIQEDDE